MKKAQLHPVSSLTLYNKDFSIVFSNASNASAAISTHLYLLITIFQLQHIPQNQPSKLQSNSNTKSTRLRFVFDIRHQDREESIHQDVAALAAHPLRRRPALLPRHPNNTRPHARRTSRFHGRRRSGLGPRVTKATDTFLPPRGAEAQARHPTSNIPQAGATICRRRRRGCNGIAGGGIAGQDVGSGRYRVERQELAAAGE